MVLNGPMLPPSSSTGSDTASGSGPDTPLTTVSASGTSISGGSTDPVPGGQGADRSSEEDVARLLRRPEALRCVYQPVIDLRSGDLAGYEALTRVADWPARSPQPWFAAAARSGLAGQLEAASLQNALRARSGLGAEQFLAVNLAAPLMNDPAVLEVLRRVSDLSGVVVELGGGETGSDPSPTGALAALRMEGLRIACDLIEGGRTELGVLERAQPDLLKLDGKLVRGAHDDKARDRLIRLVISLAEQMGAVVLAEGVESLDDARHMQELGVRLSQGWLFGRARPTLTPPAPEVANWLRATWEETLSHTRVGRLVRKVPVAGTVGEDAIADARWTAQVDDAGRLMSLVERGGEEDERRVIPASKLLRLRAAQDLRSAAVRVLASDPERRASGLLVITDEAGTFLGVTDPDSLMREVLAEPS